MSLPGFFVASLLGGIVVLALVRLVVERFSLRRLTRHVPVWLLVGSSLGLLGSLGLGVWLDKSGVGNENAYAVNLLSSLTGAAAGIPVVAILLPALLDRRRDHELLERWKPYLEDLAQEASALAIGWLRMLASITADGERVWPKASRVLSIETADHFRAIGPLTKLELAPAYMRQDETLNQWVDDWIERALSFTASKLADISGVTQLSDVEASLRTLRSSRGLQNRLRNSLPSPGLMRVSKMSDEELIDGWLRWCADVTELLTQFDRSVHDVLLRAGGASDGRRNP